MVCWPSDVNNTEPESVDALHRGEHRFDLVAVSVARLSDRWTYSLIEFSSPLTPDTRSETLSWRYCAKFEFNAGNFVLQLRRNCPGQFFLVRVPAIRFAGFSGAKIRR